MPPQVVHAPRKCAPALLALGCYAVYSSCTLTGSRLAVAAFLVIMAASSVLADLALVMCRAPAEQWDMSAPVACLLLSQYVPASAQLFAEFRRLRDGLSPAEARSFAGLTQEDMGDSQMVVAVRLCACPTLCPGACRVAEPKSAAPQFSSTCA